MRKVGQLSNGMILVEMSPSEYQCHAAMEGDPMNSNNRRGRRRSICVQVHTRRETRQGFTKPLTSCPK